MTPYGHFDRHRSVRWLWAKTSPSKVALQPSPKTRGSARLGSKPASAGVYSVQMPVAALLVMIGQVPVLRTKTHTVFTTSLVITF